MGPARHCTSPHRPIRGLTSLGVSPRPRRIKSPRNGLVTHFDAIGLGSISANNRLILRRSSRLRSESFVALSHKRVCSRSAVVQPVRSQPYRMIDLLKRYVDWNFPRFDPMLQGLHADHRSSPSAVAARIGPLCVSDLQILLRAYRCRSKRTPA